MLLKYFYDPKLAHASYLVGCQATGEAIVIDPAREIDQYIKVAAENEMNIIAGAETHIHADYVSGMRELAERLNAHLYVSDEGDENWKYEYARAYNHTLVKHGDQFKIGNIVFEVLSTPGHTPESISFMLTDSAGANKPMGVFTGDFVFVGDIGRPDLLEEAAGIKGTKEIGAKAMFKSITRFKQLPDYLQIWPAHGAGSACGKALGAIPSSTLGYEKQFNWAFGVEDEERFVDTLLDGQPAPPKYFAVMKRVNKEGPQVLNDGPAVPKYDANKLAEILNSDTVVVDTRSQAEFATKHIAGTYGIPLNKSFNTYAGWVLPYDKPVYLIIDENKLKEAVHDLLYVGLDNIKGFFPTEAINIWKGDTASFQLAEPKDVSTAVSTGQIRVLDVRAAQEFEAGHIPGAFHIPLTNLFENIGEIPYDKSSPILLNCRSGGRSFVAAGILNANGFSNVMNLEGGIIKWQEMQLPVENGTPEMVEA